MKWRGRRTSGNIIDQRGGRGSGGGGRRGGGGPGLKIGGVGAIIVVALGVFLGVDVSPFLGGGNSGGGIAGDPTSSSGAPNRIDDESEQFIAVVLADTEEIWTDIFRQSGLTYEAPKLVLFDGQVNSACGRAGAATGPFYCHADRRAYLDTSFFQVLSERLGARGDFAVAYVIAHEVAHHVQNLLGTLPRVNAQRQRVSKRDSNRLSVMIELQADCYSGLWARQVQARFGTLEPGDIEEALNAASRIGDDTLQRSAGRAVVPDSFQHGTSAQRMRWFRRGYDTGDPGQCNTFETSRL